MKKLVTSLLILCTVLLSGCSSWSNKEVDVNAEYRGLTAKQLYDQANQSVNKGNYKTAIREFEAMETLYPFSTYAQTAQTKLMDAYYKNEEYASAAASAQRYIHLYPRAENVDYAYYLKGLANFQQYRGAFAKFLPMDESWRDPGTEAQAYADFGIFIQRFPNSKYKADALQRMIYLRNMFAQRELNNANYYFERQLYVAAVERANYLIENYPQAPSAEQALTIAYRANIKLGLQAAAADVAKVYEATYHKSMKV
ncbi:outer membrane protein assembly factor BamD [Legionella sp. W05-934-2]|jgi:outer membrane protein assembly factor BamD|uniref:outer membrane protein assembly factor BamD n=1 Tax=Legionella sp. W05-934-2 TaxID=1198649 RepID=UPI0034623DC6